MLARFGLGRTSESAQDTKAEEEAAAKKAEEEAAAKKAEEEAAAKRAEEEAAAKKAEEEVAAKKAEEEAAAKRAEEEAAAKKAEEEAAAKKAEEEAAAKRAEEEAAAKKAEEQKKQIEANKARVVGTVREKTENGGKVESVQAIKPVAKPVPPAQDKTPSNGVTVPSNKPTEQTSTKKSTGPAKLAGDRADSEALAKLAEDRDGAAVADTLRSMVNVATRYKGYLDRAMPEERMLALAKFNGLPDVEAFREETKSRSGSLTKSGNLSEVYQFVRRYGAFYNDFYVMLRDAEDSLRSVFPGDTDRQSAMLYVMLLRVAGDIGTNSAANVMRRLKGDSELVRMFTAAMEKEYRKLASDRQSTDKKYEVRLKAARLAFGEVFGTHMIRTGMISSGVPIRFLRTAMYYVEKGIMKAPVVDESYRVSIGNPDREGPLDGLDVQTVQQLLAYCQGVADGNVRDASAVKSLRQLKETVEILEGQFNEQLAEWNKKHSESYGAYIQYKDGEFVPAEDVDRDAAEEALIVKQSADDLHKMRLEMQLAEDALMVAARNKAQEIGVDSAPSGWIATIDELCRLVLSQEATADEAFRALQRSKAAIESGNSDRSTLTYDTVRMAVPVKESAASSIERQMNDALLSELASERAEVLKELQSVEDELRNLYDSSPVAQRFLKMLNSVLLFSEDGEYGMQKELPAGAWETLDAEGRLRRIGTIMARRESYLEETGGDPADDALTDLLARYSIALEDLSTTDDEADAARGAESKRRNDLSLDNLMRFGKDPIGSVLRFDNIEDDDPVLDTVNSEEYRNGRELDILNAIKDANPTGVRDTEVAEDGTIIHNAYTERLRAQTAREELMRPGSEQAAAVSTGRYASDGSHEPSTPRSTPATERVRAMSTDERLDAFRTNPNEYSRTSETLSPATKKDMSLNDALKNLAHTVYRHGVNEAESIDRFAKRQTSAVTASHLAKMVQNSTEIAGTIFKENLLDHNWRIAGMSAADVTLCWAPDPKNPKRQIVDTKAQAAFQEYLYLMHHVDRMQLAEKAEMRVKVMYQQHPYLADLTAEEAGQLAAEGNEVVLELGRRVEYRNRILAEQADGLYSKAVLADPEYPERAMPVDKALNRAAVLRNEYMWLEEKADALYRWYDVFMREWAVGTSITEYGYNLMHEMYPHYVPTNRTSLTAYDIARSNLMNWVAKNPEFKNITNEEVKKLAEGGNAKAAKYIELRLILEQSDHVIDLSNRPVSGGTFSAARNSFGTDRATHEATGSLRTLIPLEDQVLDEVQRIVRMRITNDLLSNIAKEALLDYDRTLFGQFAQFDEKFTDKSIGKGEEELANDADLEHMITIEGTGKDAKYYIAPWIDGKRVRVAVSKGMYQGLVYLTNRTASDPTQEWLRLAMTAGRAVSGRAKMMITGVNPNFALRNIARDFQTAIANSIVGAAFPRYMVQAAREIACGSENWITFCNLGGKSAGYLQNTYKRRVLLPDEKRSGIDAATDEASTFEKIMETLGKPGEISESVTRFAEYLATVDRSRPGTEGLSDAQLRTLGIKNAAEVTVDFSRSGSLTKSLNSFVLYFNPQVQGLDKAIRTVTEQPGWKKLTKLGYLAVTNALPVLIGQVLLKALGKWDDWNDQSDYVKANYFTIPIDPDGRKWLRIPRSREWGQIFGVLTYRMFEEASGRDGFLEGYWENSIKANVAPPGLSSIVLLGPLLDIRNNKDYSGNAIVPYSLEGKSPKNQYDEDTSLIAYAVGQIANWSPKQIDYFVKSFCGDFYFSLLKIVPASLVTEEQDGDTVWVTLKENAGQTMAKQLTGTWVTDVWKSNQITTDYYDMMQKLSTLRKDEGEEGSKHDAIYDALMSNNGLGKQLQDIAKSIRNLPDGDERDSLYALRNALMLDAVEFIKKCESGEIPDPKLYALYKDYGADILAEARRLNGYADEYDFAPSFPRVSYITDPDNRGYRYEFKDGDEEMKDLYQSMCRQEYSLMVQRTMANEEYQSGTELTQAILLSLAKDQAVTNARASMAEYLQRAGRTSRKTTESEMAVEERNAQYAFDRMLGQSKFSRTTTDELLRLYNYSGDYAFMPSAYVPSKYTDPDNKANQYVLTDTDKSQYKAIRDTVTNRVYELIVRSDEYNALPFDTARAQLLAAARNECTTISRLLMLEWLARNGKSVPKKTEEDRATEILDEYFSGMAKSILRKNGITY